MIPCSIYCIVLAMLMNAEEREALSRNLAEYERVTDLAWAKYRQVADPARAKYQRVADLAWGKYQRVADSARAEYQRVADPARAEYQRVVDLAWAGLSEGSGRVVAWIVSHCHKHRGEADQILQALADGADLHGLEDIADQQGWCGIWDHYLDGARTAGIIL